MKIVTIIRCLYTLIDFFRISTSCYIGKISMKEAHLKLEKVNLLTRHVRAKRHLRSRIK